LKINFLNKFFNIPNNFYSKQNKYLLISTIGGIGYIKKAPGTFASFLTLLFAICVGYVSSTLLIIFFTLCLILGFFVCEQSYSENNIDPSYIVIDEVVGQLLAVILVYNNIWLAVLSFVIFRILDITKPWIIGMCETKFKGGVAIMMDDIVAGFITLIIVTTISIFI
jgi:phosphatidylglycerophosphatase A